MKKKKYYIDPAEMLVETNKFMETDEISEKLHMMFYRMCREIITGPRFYRYTPERKEDMIHSAYVKCIVVLNRKRYCSSKSTPFNYFTTVIKNSFKDSAGAEKKQIKVVESIREVIEAKSGPERFSVDI